MRILGLSSLKHDTAVALLEDGVFRAAIENDKLARTRTRDIPSEALAACFQNLKIGWDGIDIIAIATQPIRGWSRRSWLWSKHALSAPIASGFNATEEAGTLTKELNHLRVLRRRAVGSSHQIAQFDHHLCHAASAYYQSPFERSLILVMDEDGDGLAATVAIGEGNRIRTVRTIPFPHSLAWVYSQITALLGFRHHLDEHKLQWLSLEGEPVHKDLFLKMLAKSDDGSPRLDYSYFRRGLAGAISFSAKFYQEAGLPADPKQITDDQKKALASSIQAACTEVIAGFVNHLRREHKINQVCFGGGLFLNVLLVSSLENALGMNDVFVPPAPGNAGTALGAASLYWHQTLQKPRTQPLDNVYLGPKFPGQAVKDVLDNTKSRYVLPNTEDRKLDTTVQLLASGKIVGWFQGAAEFGPRALGNRSVLASPWAPYVKENLNDFIKHREWFRPFAISVPEEDCDKYFEASRQCRFMNSMARVRPDSTCLPESFLLPGQRVRLHVVERNSNPIFWALLKRFGEHSPAPMLLNTSFNLFGEPLVVTPRDAMRSYFGSGLDALIIERFVLSKTTISMNSVNLPTTRVGIGA